MFQAAQDGINAFDQWGVELGKVLSTGVYQALTADKDCSRFDGSTNALINRVKLQPSPVKQGGSGRT